jgi:hypothetical protein
MRPETKAELIQMLYQAKGYALECVEADPTFNHRAARGDYRNVTEYAYAHLFNHVRQEAKERYGIDYYGKSIEDMIDALNAVDSGGGGAA